MAAVVLLPSPLTEEVITNVWLASPGRNFNAVRTWRIASARNDNGNAVTAIGCRETRRSRGTEASTTEPVRASTCSEESTRATTSSTTTR